MDESTVNPKPITGEAGTATGISGDEMYAFLKGQGVHVGATTSMVAECRKKFNQHFKLNLKASDFLDLLERSDKASGYRPPAEPKDELLVRQKQQSPINFFALVSAGAVSSRGCE